MLSHEERLRAASNPLVKKILKIMVDKKSNLCVAVNFRTLAETLSYIEVAAKHIVILKSQCDGYEDSNPRDSLKALAEAKLKHNFIIFEDKKYGDEGSATKRMYDALCFPYADLVSVLDDALYGSIATYNESLDEPRGCVGVLEKSYSEAPDQTTLSRRLGIAERAESCVGIVSQKLQLTDCTNMLKLSPGVHLSQSGSGNQRWEAPSEKLRNGADIIIVGRGIVSAPSDQLESLTEKYKQVAYQAYLDLVVG